MELRPNNPSGPFPSRRLSANALDFPFVNDVAKGLVLDPSAVPDVDVAKPRSFELAGV